MQRKTLEDLGLEKDVIGKIMAENGSDIEKAKIGYSNPILTSQVENIKNNNFNSIFEKTENPIENNNQLVYTDDNTNNKDNVSYSISDNENAPLANEQMAKINNPISTQENIPVNKPTNNTFSVPAGIPLNNRNTNIIDRSVENGRDEPYRTYDKGSKIFDNGKRKTEQKISEFVANNDRRQRIQPITNRNRNSENGITDSSTINSIRDTPNFIELKNVIDKEITEKELNSVYKKYTYLKEVHPDDFLDTLAYNILIGNTEYTDRFSDVINEYNRNNIVDRSVENGDNSFEEIDRNINSDDKIYDKIQKQPRRKLQVRDEVDNRRQREVSIDERGSRIAEKRNYLNLISEKPEFVKFSQSISKELNDDEIENIIFLDDHYLDYGPEYIMDALSNDILNGKTEYTDRFSDAINEYNSYSNNESNTDNEGNTIPSEILETTKNSKIRNNNGKLKVVYHSSNANFDTFEQGDIGFHFGSKSQAVTRANQIENKEPIINAYYLNIESPLVINQDMLNWKPNSILINLTYKQNIMSESEYKYFNNKYENELFNADYNSEVANELREWFKNKGYDGIVYTNEIESRDNQSYIAFDNSQIFKLSNNENDLNETASEQNNIDYAISDDNQISEKDNSKEKIVDISKSTNTNVEFFNQNTTSENYEEISKDVAEQVERYKKGELKSYEVINLGNTPLILQKLGAKKLPMTISQDVIGKATQIDVGGKIIDTEKVNAQRKLKNQEEIHFHEVYIDNIKDLPREISDPMIILKSKKISNGLVVITKIKDSSNDNILVALHLNNYSNGLKINRIASFYGKENLGSFVNGQLSNILFLNKGKSQQWFKDTGLQLPKLKTFIDSYDNSIFHENNIVNSIIDKNSKNYAMENNVNAFYDDTTNTIYINENADKPYLTLLGHELYHSLSERDQNILSNFFFLKHRMK